MSVTWPAAVGADRPGRVAPDARVASVGDQTRRTALARRRVLAPVGAVLLIAAIFISLRCWLATTPFLSETYYDEALTGLMSLAILRGVPQVFYWGQPYLGAEDAYLAAAAFRLFGVSTLVLRLVVASTAVLWAWAAWSLGRRIAGGPAGLVAGLYLAVPPIFLSYIQLSSHGETVSLTLGTLVLAAVGALLDPGLGRRGRGVAWVALGLTGGLGWWASQMMGMFLVAGALAVLVARPRVMREPGPYVALGLFTLASLPFWIWNARHEWATFWHLVTWGDPLPPTLGGRFQNVLGPLLASMRGQFWDSRWVVLPPGVTWLWWVVVSAFYVPALGVALGQLSVWATRAWRRTRPWQEPLDLVVLAFWLTVVAHLVTWFGTSGVLRYSMTFYATIPILGAVALGRMGRHSRVARAVAVAVTALVLGYNGATNIWFVRAAAAAPWRPVDEAIATLRDLGVRACYADSRIAQVIAFESQEQIECADYSGLRNYAALQAVDAVDDPAQVAIVTHRVLQGPSPETMAEMLKLIGARAQMTEAADYVIFHHITPPPEPVRPIDPAGWRATASGGEGAAGAFDRKVWTWWTVPKRDGEWFRLDLGRPHPLAQLVLVAAPEPTGRPLGLSVDTSLDGRTWEPAAKLTEIVPGFHWWKGHPRADESGQVLIRMTPRPARYVRLVHLTSGLPGANWGIGEIFAFETTDASWTPPLAAVEALASARRELAHWMDDPGGPNPRRAPVTYLHRRGQVAWSRVFAAADQALAAAPQWEEAHHLYGFALALSGWSSDADEMIERARRDRAWTEVLRWADLADAQRGEFWRSGRNTARAEALAALGPQAPTAQTAIPPPPLPARRVRARFGGELELVGLDLPTEGRPGQALGVRYYWRALSTTSHDYWAFVHVHGEHREINEDHVLGAPTYGTSRWSAGEVTQEALTLSIPPDTPPGVYRITLGVWLPKTGKRLRLTAADLPQAPRAVEVGTIRVIGPDETDPGRLHQ